MHTAWARLGSVMASNLLHNFLRCLVRVLTLKQWPSRKVSELPSLKCHCFLLVKQDSQESPVDPVKSIACRMVGYKLFPRSVTSCLADPRLS